MTTLSQEFSFTRVTTPAGTGATILLVEDDHYVRRAACEVLREAGFDLIEAETVAAVRAILRSSAVSVGVLVCDAILPDGDGIELARYFVAVSPRARVILTSGYPLADIALNEVPDQYFLAKPYSGRALKAALHHVFGAAQKDEVFLAPPVMDRLQNMAR